MRAAGITALGSPVEIFEVDELATPAAGEVLIDVVAAGIGNWDDLVRIGSWQVGGPAPMALGTEAAGTVAAVGSGVSELREGDEVMTHPLPLRRHGTWARRLLAPAATVAARPPGASWEACAAFPYSGADCGSGTRRGARDRERRLGRRQRSRWCYGWAARSARRGSGRTRDRDREPDEGRAHPRLRRVGGARLSRRLACARPRDHRRRRAQGRQRRPQAGGYYVAGGR